MRRLLFALAVGPVTVALTDGAAWALLGRDMWTDEQGMIAWRAFWISLPFLILLALDVRAKASWIAAAVATFAFFGFFTALEIERQLAGDESGANIGYGLLALVFPVIALAVAGVAHLVTGAATPSIKYRRQRRLE